MTGIEKKVGGKGFAGQGFADSGWAAVPTSRGHLYFRWRGSVIAEMRIPGLAPRDGSVPEEPAPMPPWASRLAADLKKYFSGDPVDLSPWLDRLDRTGLTPFRAKVYAVVGAIPRGETLTYGEVARRAGSPGAARAVGGAMAANPWAPVVPCHRVVPAAGGPGGYGGGAALKERLLAMEGASLP